MVGVTVAAMSDGPLTSRQKPTRPPASLADLALIVRPPGDPFGIRAYTDAERIDAEVYAAAVGAAVEPLPRPAATPHGLHSL